MKTGPMLTLDDCRKIVVTNENVQIGQAGIDALGK